MKSSLRKARTPVAPVSRRRVLGFGLACSAGLVAGPRLALAAAPEKTLAFHNLHTGESLKTTFWADGAYVPEGLAEIRHVLRDHRTGDEKEIDPELLDLLHALARKVEVPGPFGVISGYRSPATNAMLRKTGGGGVAKKSFHMKGQAIDIRVDGCRIADLHKAAVRLKRGGVGYYPQSGFIHVDTGPVRRWS